MKRFTIVTLFPEFIDSFRRTGIVRRCLESGLAAIDTVNPRDFAVNRRGNVDDSPYGGGPGMIMMVEPLRKAITAVKGDRPQGSHVVYLTPQGRRFDHRSARDLGAYDHLILIAGRYEGIDQRVVERDVDSEWSVGDFVVSGGELPAMLMIDAIVRLLPGALGDERSALEDSFCEGLLDYPHYTRPERIDGQSAPPVLLSGDHRAIDRWRRMQRLGRTILKRPDLLEAETLDDDDQRLLEEFLEKSWE
ncbi:MAG: tRNA (guanosine(37)-N1)-methyltransferase TrmD [Pseudomonadota bacterium]|nr:tRNA (guanosine(37)-N1)-methyltransferase TrmD [Pseudomonadota bacterium]